MNVVGIAEGGETWSLKPVDVALGYPLPRTGARSAVAATVASLTQVCTGRIAPSCTIPTGTLPSRCLESSRAKKQESPLMQPGTVCESGLSPVLQRVTRYEASCHLQGPQKE
jgi:hypothetical protein